MMIKNKDKQQLIELTYQLIVENKMLMDELDTIKNNTIFNKILNYIMYPICWIHLITQYKKIHDMRTLTRKELIDTFNVINKYEDKQYPTLIYKDLFVNITNIKLCKGCGVGLDRIHTDLQRIILAQIKKVCPEVIPSIILYSGKYASSDFYMNSIPFNTFDANYVILNKMKVEHKQFKTKGYIEQTQLIETDIKTLSDYLSHRKTSTIIDNVQTVSVFDALKSKSEVKLDIIAEKVENVIDVVDEIIEKVTTDLELNVGSFVEDDKSPYNFIKESEEKVPTNSLDLDLDIEDKESTVNGGAEMVTIADLNAYFSDLNEEDDIVINGPKIVAKTPDFNVEKAYNMKQAGASNTEIGAHFGVSYQHVAKQLKGFMKL